MASDIEHERRRTCEPRSLEALKRPSIVHDDGFRRGRVRSSAQTTDGQIYRFGYDHNWIGLKSIRYPSTRLVSYGYDGGGRVNQVGGYASGIQYAPHGAVSQMMLGNSLVETTGFNTRLQPASIAAGSLLSLGYGYGTGASNNGNLISQTITADGRTFTQSYTYDGLNRLAAASEGSAWSRAFGYDAYGNMWVVSGSGVPVDSFTARSASAYDAQNRRVGAEAGILRIRSVCLSFYVGQAIDASPA